MNIGIIGSGNIGAALTRRLRDVGHEVAVANATGPLSLAKLASETGAQAASVNDVARQKDIVIIAIPMKEVGKLPASSLDGAAADLIVVDTSNYYPRQRDGRIDALELGQTESVWVEQQLGRPVVKAFNMVVAPHLLDRGKPEGTAGRIAMAVAGDDAAAKANIITLIDQLDFDPVDAGSIDESWRQQPGTPGYCRDYDAGDLRRALSEATRGRAVEWQATAKSPGTYASPA